MIGWFVLGCADNVRVDWAKINNSGATWRQSGIFYRGHEGLDKPSARIFSKNETGAFKILYKKRENNMPTKRKSRLRMAAFFYLIGGFP
ncbi:hypothetical protein CKA38_03965 [Ereboglobus luteus]|uniref:Uncharacterized protein n=1 Tax=Ereboglobus luteus TaxID=1796921 RepID=A0A2U8E0Z0_9BACT|nr:hypothetical protein CKA38_03965 [Ereboglobus luteus]